MKNSALKLFSHTFFTRVALLAALMMILDNAAVRAQTTIYSDDFNRATLAGGTTTYTTTATGNGTAGMLSSTALQLTSGSTAGRVSVAATMASGSGYNTALDSCSGLVTWTFNMRYGRTTAPSGFGSANYSCAYVLSSDNTDFANSGAKGYAILFGNSGSPDTFRLVAFNAGIITTDYTTAGSAAGNALITGSGTFAPSTTTADNDYYSFKVTYDPSTKIWAFYGRDDGATAFADPASGSYTTIGTFTETTAIYRATAQGKLGAFWNHGTAASQSSQFDNFKLTVSTSPTLTTPTKSAITDTTATLGATVSADGGAPIDDYGIVWATTVNPTTANNKIAFGTSVTTPSTFTVGATALTAGSVIHYRGYAHNTSGTSYSADDSFYTLSTEPSTHVGSFAAAANSSTSIGLSWTAAAGATGYLILQRAGASAPTGSPTDATTYSVGNTIGDGTVAAIVTSGATTTATINSLSASSQYSYAIFPVASDGVNAGTYNYYTAATVPTATTTTSSGSTPTISVDKSSLAFGTVVVNGTSANQTYIVSGLSLTANITITAPPNFEVSTASGSGFGNSLTLTQAGGTVPNTTIYVHFKPTAQTSYADSVTNFSSGANNPLIAVSGVGATAPAVTTQAASAITTNGVTLNGTVTASNNAVILDRGFYWKISPGVSTSDTKASEGGTDVSAFTKTLTGLSANTIYYYRAYATNVLGTTLDSADTSFYTLANTPVAPTVNGATTNTLSVAIGSDGNPAGTAYAIQETNSGNYVQANGTLNSTMVYKTATAWGTTVVTNLSLGTIYFFQVQATNGAGVATAFGPVKSVSTANLPFTPGNLVVYRVGDGATTLSAAGAPVFLDEYNVSGTRIQSFPLPTTSSGSVNALVAAGNSASEGLLTRSADGRYLMFTGYKAAVGAANVGTSSSSTTPRTVARVDNSGSTDTSTALTDLSTGSNPRTVASVDGTAFWAGGGAGGVRYAALGATTSTQIESPAFGNTRQFNIFSNQLYLSTGSSTTNRLATVGTGTPTTSGQAVTNLPGFPTTGSPYAFFFCTLNGGAGPDTVYVADDGGTTGIQKYCLVSGSWTLLGTITAANVRGLTASVSGTTVTLYGSTSGASASATGGTLYLVTDTAGYNAAPSTTTATTLATATANMAFRGVAFAPKYSQAISPITATVTKNYGDSSYSVATTASSSLTVTYASDNTSVATVNSSGIVTIIGAGIAHITANQAGNDSYAAAAQVSQTLTVNKIAPTFNLTSSSNPIGYQSSVTFTANTILPVDVTGTIQFTTNGGNLGSAVTISSGSAVSPATANLPRATTNVVKAIYSGDANYLSITNTLTQIVTNHPPVANANSYSRIGASSWTIAISDLLTNASDTDSDSLTLIALSTSTNGITLDTNSTPGVVKYSNANPVNDQFTYKVTDGFGGTNTAVITLISSSTSGVGGVANSINFSSGTTSLTFTGLPGYLYNVQVSTNLTSWNTIWTTNAPSSGVFQFTDTSAPLSAAYYRLMWNGN